MCPHHPAPAEPVSLYVPTVGPVVTFQLPFCPSGAPAQPSQEDPPLDISLPGSQGPTLAGSFLWSGSLAPQHPPAFSSTTEWVTGCLAFLEASWCPGCIMDGQPLICCFWLNPQFPICEMGRCVLCSPNSPAAQDSKFTAPFKPLSAGGPCPPGHSRVHLWASPGTSWGWCGSS